MSLRRGSRHSESGSIAGELRARRKRCLDPGGRHVEGEYGGWDF